MSRDKRNKNKYNSYCYSILLAIFLALSRGRVNFVLLGKMYGDLEVGCIFRSFLNNITYLPMLRLNTSYFFTE